MTTAVQVQYRRGTASQITSFTGAQGEVVVDTTNNRVVVQDGSTAGGWPIAGASRAAVGDANYTLSSPYSIVAFTALTAARTLSLPATTSWASGQRLLVVDESGACSATKTITLSANGSDKIDGASSAEINQPYGYIELESNASGKWTVSDQGPQVTALNNLTGQLTLQASDGLNIAASGSTITIGGPGGMVNKFRNGTMDAWQRGTSSLTATTAGAYTADGWIVTPTGASVTAAQASGRLLTKNSLQVTGATSVTDVQAMQRIESYIAAAFCSQTVTVQAQVYNGSGASITPTLTVKHAGSQDVWISPTTDVSAVSLQACANAAWTQVAYTFSASANSYNGLEVIFDFGNNFSANTKTVQITECDIRVTPGAATGLNSNPPPPELRPVGVEMPFCLRYLYVINQSTTSPVAIAMAISSSDAMAVVPFPTPMRAAPTFTSTGTWEALNSSASSAGGSVSLNQAQTTSARLDVTGASGLTGGNASALFTASTATLQFSAEL